MAFEPPTNYNSTIMVNQDYEIVSPTVEELTAANPILTYNSNLAQTAAISATTQANAAASSATTAQQAAAQATEIVDPEGWRTDTRTLIAGLAQTKYSTPILYCNGGMAKTNSAGFTTLSKATILVRFARANTTRTDEEYICNIGDGGTVNTGISLRLLADNRISVLFRFKKADGTYVGSNISAFDISEYLDGKIHSVAICWAGTSAKIYIDGILKGSVFNITSGLIIVASNINITLAGRGATNKQFFHGQLSDFAVLNYDASKVDSNGNYTSAYSIADYQNGKAIPPWSVPIVFGNGKSATVSTTNATCVWNGSNWSMTQTNNTATTKSMLYYIPLNVGQKLRIKFSNLTGGVLVDGKYGFFQAVGQEADKIDVSTTSLDAEFTAKKPITYWQFQFNCEAVENSASRVPTIFENFIVERDGAIVALENYTIARNTTTKLIKDASGNGNDATVSGVLAGDRDKAVAAFVDELKTQINQQA